VNCHNNDALGQQPCVLDDIRYWHAHAVVLLSKAKCVPAGRRLLAAKAGSLFIRRGSGDSQLIRNR